LEKYPTDDVFVIGGEKVYSELLPYCTEAYVTRIENVYKADKHFINLDADERWKPIFLGEPQSYKDIRYSFRTFINKDFLS
jgi:dihydrofolate reductase